MSNVEKTFKHFTIIADGVVEELKHGFVCEPGPAFMGMKVWASTYEEAGEMIQAIGRQIGFNVTGSIEIFDSESNEPPGENPHGYEINFTSYSI